MKIFILIAMNAFSLLVFADGANFYAQQSRTEPVYAIRTERGDVTVKEFERVMSRRYGVNVQFISRSSRLWKNMRAPSCSSIFSCFEYDAVTFRVSTQSQSTVIACEVKTSRGVHRVRHIDAYMYDCQSSLLHIEEDWIKFSTTLGQLPKLKEVM